MYSNDLFQKFYIIVTVGDKYEIILNKSALITYNINIESFLLPTYLILKLYHQLRLVEDLILRIANADVVCLLQGIFG